MDFKAYLADAKLQLNGVVNLADEENSGVPLHASLPTANIIEKFAGQDMSLLAPASFEGRIVGNATTMHLTGELLQQQNVMTVSLPTVQIGNSSGMMAFNWDTSATPDDLFRHATGNFGFAVWPREFQAGIIDLWAVGLASAVLPKIGPADPSQLNCAVGTFNLADGQIASFCDT